MTIEELRRLQEDIWKEYTHNSRYVHPHKIHMETRKLTHQEWADVMHAVVQHRLAVSMINTCMGFNCGIDIYEPPTYPGLPPEHLIRITGDHFSTKFEQTWERLYPLVNNQDNANLLEFCNLPPLKDRVYYEY